jgi:RNA polymerase sigma-70 factor (ECF subfamily)
LKGSQLYTEEELVKSLQQRKEAAFSYLYDHYAALLNGILMTILQDRDSAGDALQEVFLKIWRQIDHYNPSKSRLFTWMHLIARNTAIDITRSKDWQIRKKNNPLTEDQIGLPDNTLIRSKEQDLRKMVQVLKDDFKILVDLSYFKGYTQEEIAKMLNIPLGTVKYRLKSALIQLKQQILI